MKTSKTKTAKSKTAKPARAKATKPKAKQNVISITELYALKKQREQEKAAANGKGWNSSDSEQSGPAQEQFRAVGGGRRSGFGGSRHH